MKEIDCITFVDDATGCGGECERISKRRYDRINRRSTCRQASFGCLFAERSCEASRRGRDLRRFHLTPSLASLPLVTPIIDANKPICPLNK